MNTRVMRTTVEWPAGKTTDHTLSAVKSRRSAAVVQGLRKSGIRLLLAMLSVIATVVGTVWAVSAIATPHVLHAMIWAAGFIFLALAMESRNPNIGALLATGLALPVLAMLSARIATEFAIIAAVLIAAWIAAAILQRK